jgi:WXG100 family type VII secretion target
MTVTISTVSGSQPEQVLAAAAHAGNSATTVSQQIDAGKQNLAALKSGWEGGASEAAVASAERTLIEQQKISDVLRQLQSALSDGGSQLSAIRSGIVDGVESLTQQGWHVADDGTVTVRPGSPLDQLAKLSPVTAMQLRQIAAASSVKLKAMLAQFDGADRALADAVRKATAGLDASAAPAGPPNRSDNASPSEPKPKDGNTTAPEPGPGAKPGGVDGSGQTTPPTQKPAPGSPQSAPRTPAQPPSAPTPRPASGTTPAQAGPSTPGRNPGAAPTRPASTNTGSAPVQANTPAQEPATRSGPTSAPSGAGAPPVGRGGPASATASMPATSAPTRFDGGTATATGTASAATSGGERVFTAFDGGAGNLPDKHTYQIGDDGWPIHVWVDDGEEVDDDDW